MNRRNLLGLLGLGGASGLGYLVYGPSGEQSTNPSSEPDTGTQTGAGDQTTSPDRVTGTEAPWQATMQSNLRGEPVPSDVSFADEAATVALDDSETLHSIAVEPTDTTADVFRFDTASTETRAVAAVVRDSIGISDDIRIDGSVDGTATTFEASQARIAPYVAALGIVQDSGTVLIVRADSRSTLEGVL